MRIPAVVGLLALLLLGFVAVPADASGRFVDDDGNVHESAIETIAAAGITLGCNPPDNDRYCPDDPVTRAQMATFLDRLLGLDPTTGDAFGDDDGNIHEAAINRLAASGITLGCNPPANDRYCPDAPVTRAQMATFLTRALGLPVDPTDRFGDDDGDVHEDSINRLAASGITRGCNPPANDRYCPSASVTRAQMATFLDRAGDLVPTEPPPPPSPNQPPVAVADTYAAVQGVTLTVPSGGVLTNDSDPDGDPLTAALVSGPDDGNLTLLSNGGFTYEPRPAFVGTDTFTYRASDGEDLSAVATVTITVEASVVVATDDVYETAFATTLRVQAGGSAPGVKVTGSVLGNDTGGVGTVEATLVDGPDHGLLDLAADGTFTYTPEFGFTGIDTFTYRAADAFTSDEAMVEVDVSTTRVVYVDGNAPAPPSAEYLGTLAHPYTNVFDALDGSLPGDVVFVFAGSYDTAVRPKPGQALVGEAVGLEVDGLDIVDPGPRPFLDTRIELANDTTVTGLTAVAAIAENEFGTVTFTDVELTGLGVPTLFASGTGVVLVDAASSIASPSTQPAVELGAAVAATIHAPVDGGIRLNSTSQPVTFTGPIDASGLVPTSCVDIVGAAAPVVLSGGGTLESCATGINLQSSTADVTITGAWTIEELGTGILVQGVSVGTDIVFGPGVSVSGNTTGLSVLGVNGSLSMQGLLSDSLGAMSTVRISQSDGSIDIGGPVDSARAGTSIEIVQSSADITFSGGGSIVDADFYGVLVDGPVTGGSVTFSGDWTFDGNGADPGNPSGAAFLHRPLGPMPLTLGAGVEIANSHNHGIALVFDGDLVMDGTITHSGTEAAISASSHTGQVTVNGTITGGRAVDAQGTGSYVFNGAITSTDPEGTAITLGAGDHTFTAPVTITGTGSGVDAFGSGDVTFASLDVATTGFALALSQVDSFDVTDDTGTLSSSAGPVLVLSDVGLPPVLPFTSVSSTKAIAGTSVTIQNLDMGVPLTINGLAVTQTTGVSAYTGILVADSTVILNGATVTVDEGIQGAAVQGIDANVTIAGGTFDTRIDLIVADPGLTTTIDGVEVDGGNAEALDVDASAATTLVVTDSTFTTGTSSTGVSVRSFSPATGIDLTMTNVVVDAPSASWGIDLQNFAGDASWTLTDSTITVLSVPVFAVQVRSWGGTACLAATGNALVTGRFDLVESGGQVSISQANQASLSADNDGAAVTVTGAIGFDCVP